MGLRATGVKDAVRIDSCLRLFLFVFLFFLKNNNNNKCFNI